MMTNVFYIIGVVIGMYAGWHLHKGRVEDVTKRQLEVEQDERENNSFKPSIHGDKVDVYIKKSEGIFYVYAADDGTFLAQGKTQEEIQERLGDRFPGKSFFGSPENIKEVDYK